MKNIKSQLETVVETLIDDLKLSIEKEIKETASAEIINHIVKNKLEEAIESVVEKKVKSLILSDFLPHRTINHKCVDFDGFKITGDFVNGGIIQNFGSTGIEDRATSVQLTLLDNACVFEKAIFAPRAEIKGDLVIDGDLDIKGLIPKSAALYQELVSSTTSAVKDSMNDEFFKNYADIIFSGIKKDGIDLDKISQNGKEVVKGNQLGYHITDTNIQKTGIVRDFQSAGETLLSSTLYVTNKRTGINTLDPSAAFVVWDEEVELVMSKRRQDEGIIGTIRPQKVVVSSNKKDNIVCNTDGSVQIDNLHVGKIQITSGASAPNYSSQLGHIVFNQNPSLGGPMGWVCLGGTRWANFGVID